MGILLCSGQFCAKIIHVSTFTHITYKEALSWGFSSGVQVNSVLKSLLSAFTHITYKGALSRGFRCFRSILC